MIHASVIRDGVLSDAQLESLVYAGEAHETYLAGRYRVEDGWDVMSAAENDDAEAVRFRRGWFLGDGTGAGKGRQVAAILLDHWLRGRRRAVWISKSDKLIEDARRDWMAMGGRGGSPFVSAFWSSLNRPNIAPDTASVTDTSTMARRMMLAGSTSSFS